MIYVIGTTEEDSVVKIGYTSGKPEERLHNLQTGNSRQLVVRWSEEGDLELEAYLHRVFRAHRLRGEWFDLKDSGNPVEAIRQAIRDAPLWVRPLRLHSTEDRALFG